MASVVPLFHSSAAEPEGFREDGLQRGSPRDTVISVQNVARRFTAGRKTNTALSDVSFEVGNGEFLTLIGRSGSGKSTLLRMISGLLDTSEGAIELDGKPVIAPPAEVRYVFQNYGESLLPWQTARQNVAFGADHAETREGKSKVVAEHYLELVGLAEAADRYPWELSGGMQQRLAIARALASRPRILLMDEPFGAVDALSRARLQDLLLKLWEEFRLTIILVTHDIDEAVFLSDRVIVLDAAGQGVSAELQIELPRPRDQLESREDQRFAGHRRRLHSLVLE